MKWLVVVKLFPLQVWDSAGTGAPMAAHTLSKALPPAATRAPKASRWSSKNLAFESLNSRKLELLKARASEKSSF